MSRAFAIALELQVELQVELSFFPVKNEVF